MTNINIRKVLNPLNSTFNQKSAQTGNTGGTNSGAASGNTSGTSSGTAAGAAGSTSASSGVQNSSNLVPMDTSSPKFPANTPLSNWGSGIKTANSLKLNVLQNTDRSAYLKESLDLPQNLNEFIFMEQQNLTKKQTSGLLQQQSGQQTTHTKTISDIQSQILSRQAYIKEATTAKQNILQAQQNNSLPRQNNSLPQQNVLNNQTNAAPNSNFSAAAYTAQTNAAIQTGAAAQAQLAGQIIRQNIQNRTTADAQKQILSDLDGLNSEIQSAEEALETAVTKALQSELKKLDITGGMISLDKISRLIQKNGKLAITKIIMNMTEASKSGITDLSQMKEMAKFINASISVAAEDNPQKTLKMFLLLYLPWLPLEEGVGFDIEIEERKQESGQESDSILIITVTTINYGTVKAVLILETSNSVQVTIDCSDKFPKKELQLRIEKEQTFYSMESVLTFKTDENIKPDGKQKQAASVNMAQTTEINPFLLLMAHALIKHIIEIDNNKTLGLSSHTDKF